MKKGQRSRKMEFRAREKEKQKTDNLILASKFILAGLFKYVRQKKSCFFCFFNMQLK